MIDPTNLRLPLNPTIEPSARPLLSKELYPLLAAYLGVMERYARAHSVPVSSVEISSFDDPEDGRRQLVIAQRVDLPADEVMAYWHRVGEAIEDWVVGLSQGEASEVAEWIALEVSSDADDAAA